MARDDIDFPDIEELDSGFDIELPSGAHFTAITQDEAELVREKLDRYRQDFELTNISDMADIDTVVQFEVIVQRWNNFISSGENERGEPIDITQYQKQVKDVARSLLDFKKQLGIDRVTRDKAEGEHSVSQYITSLLHRAKEFGVNREEMLAKGIELSMELIHKVDLYDNSTEAERNSVSISQDEIFEWIRTVFKPEFMAVDEHFRKNVQRTWIRDQ